MLLDTGVQKELADKALHLSLSPQRQVVLKPLSVLGGWKSLSVRMWLTMSKTRTPVTARRDLLLDAVVVFQTKLSDMGVGRENP